jgi:hypothetical protein
MFEARAPQADGNRVGRDPLARIQDVRGGIDPRRILKDLAIEPAVYDRCVRVVISEEDGPPDDQRNQAERSGDFENGRSEEGLFLFLPAGRLALFLAHWHTLQIIV